MILACAGMLLLPSFWERRSTAEPAVGPPASFPGRSTLRSEDLVPEWRGPGRELEKDG